MKREKQNRIENKRGYDLVKCYFIILSALKMWCEWVCVCSFLMPVKCQQNKSLRRCLKYSSSFFYIFAFNFALCSFSPSSNALVADGSDASRQNHLYSVYETLFFISAGRSECARCACECIFVSIYQLDFGELLKHFLFINYGWYDLLRTIYCTMVDGIQPQAWCIYGEEWTATNRSFVVFLFALLKCQ